MTPLLETADLLAFARTVETGALSRAATELNVPRVTLARQLGRLEARLGVKLLRRTTRRLALTDAGEELYAHARAVIEAAQAAEAAVIRSDGAVRGLLRVAVPPESAAFAGLFVAFARRYPDVRLEVHASTQHVDLLAGQADVAIRAGAELHPGLVGRALQSTALVAVATPEYLARRGRPESPADLRRHACLTGFARGERPTTHWPLRTGGSVRVEGAFCSNEVRLLAVAAVSGLGIALVPEVVVEAELAAGALERVLADEVGTTSQVAVVFAEREYLPPAVRAFVDFVVQWREHGEGCNGAPAGLPRASAGRPMGEVLRAVRKRG